MGPGFILYGSSNAQRAQALSRNIPPAFVVKGAPCKKANGQYELIDTGFTMPEAEKNEKSWEQWNHILVGKPWYKNVDGYYIYCNSPNGEWNLCSPTGSGEDRELYYCSDRGSAMPPNHELANWVDIEQGCKKMPSFTLEYLNKTEELQEELHRKTFMKYAKRVNAAEEELQNAEQSIVEMRSSLEKAVQRKNRAREKLEKARQELK